MAEGNLARVKACTKCGVGYPADEGFYLRPPRNGRAASYEQPCKPCRRATTAKYRDCNPERTRLAARAHYDANREAYINRAKAHYERHRHSRLALLRQRYWENPEGHRETSRRLAKAYRERQGYRERRRAKYEAYRERAAILNRRWYDNNREAAKLRVADRRAHIMGHGGKIPASVVRKLLVNQGRRCWWCLAPVGSRYHLDHRIPLKRGGPHRVDNIVVSCPTCNLRKGAKMPWEMDDPRLL